MNSPEVSSTAVIYLRVSTKEQAKKGGSSEGYSIPAQREACLRKVESLKATVLAEFVDRGESARSANRAELQALLRFVEENHVDYVVVHKVDRLARNRVDDVKINVAPKQAGVILVSVTENIDETPSGLLLHGIMSSIAEFYSRNLANEVMKGSLQKVRNGGTPTMAPIGYLNVRRVVEGRETRTIDLDPDRAPLMRWAFEQYATGDWTLRGLLQAVTEKGLTTGRARGARAGHSNSRIFTRCSGTVTTKASSLTKEFSTPANTNPLSTTNCSPRCRRCWMPTTQPQEPSRGSIRLSKGQPVLRRLRCAPQHHERQRQRWALQLLLLPRETGEADDVPAEGHRYRPGRRRDRRLLRHRSTGSGHGPTNRYLGGTGTQVPPGLRLQANPTAGAPCARPARAENEAPAGALRRGGAARPVEDRAKQDRPGTRSGRDPLEAGAGPVRPRGAPADRRPRADHGLPAGLPRGWSPRPATTQPSVLRADLHH